jgi:hypothetical protein
MAITNSVLPLVLARAREVWPGNMSEKDFIARTITLDAIRDQQTARIDYTNLPDGVDARIAWIANCDIEVEELVTTDCTFSGPEADTYRKDLVIDQAKQSTFSVPLDAWRDNLFGFADALAVNLLTVMKKQAEAVNAYGVTVINASLGVNEYDNMGQWTIAGTDTSIPGEQWQSTSIMGKFMIAGDRNDILNPILLSGENMAELAYMARTSAGNGEGSGDFRRINELRIFNDIRGVDGGNAGALRTYMIERGALAFLSKGYYPVTPEVINGDFTRFQVRNRFVPELVHDVETHTSCVSGVWKQHWKVIPRYKIELNPTGCVGTRTGLLGFTNAGI